MPADWTIDELASRVAGALDAADYPGAPNGRVREVPDRRAIRWYATIGLLDRPAAMRGRTALYGPRHLWQLVAIKRRQAQGASLAEIQHELLGASDEVLREIAGLPADAAETAGSVGGVGAAGEAAQAVGGVDAGRMTGAAGDAPGAAEGAGAADGADGAGLATRAVPPARARFWAQAPSAVTPPVAMPAEPESRPVLTGVPLGGGVVLLLPAVPDHDDLTALRSAAAPLLTELAARGLLDPTGPITGSSR